MAEEISGPSLEGSTRMMPGWLGLAEMANAMERQTGSVLRGLAMLRGEVIEKTIVTSVFFAWRPIRGFTTEEFVDRVYGTLIRKRKVNEQEF
jgi:hypothetical protein